VLVVHGGPEVPPSQPTSDPPKVQQLGMPSPFAQPHGLVMALPCWGQTSQRATRAPAYALTLRPTSGRQTDHRAGHGVELDRHPQLKGVEVGFGGDVPRTRRVAGVHDGLGLAARG
jgi:hypothetical protein